MRRLTGLATAGIAALAWGEWLHLRWSRTLVGDVAGASEAVVVLGYRNPQTTANAVNRWRVRAGIRSVTGDGAQGSRVIFSGGAVGGDAAEAQLMSDYAASVLGFAGTVLIEDRSGTTWENITNVIPLVEDVDRIKIVSQPAHALKARAYLRRQRPDLAARLVRADDYRPGEWILVKPLLALYGLRTLRALTDEERRPHRARPTVSRAGSSADLEASRGEAHVPWRLAPTCVERPTGRRSRRPAQFPRSASWS